MNHNEEKTMNEDYYKTCFAYCREACGEKCKALDRLYRKDESAEKCRFFKTQDEREMSHAMATISRLTRKYGGDKT